MNDPKVLVVGINPWVDNSGLNTLVNFFEEWDCNSLALIYTRASLPNTRVCTRFFRISEQKMIRSVLLRGTKTGDIVENTVQLAPDASQEKRLYSRRHSTLMSFCRELVWSFGNWKTKELDQFLDSYNPDVLFFPVYSTVYMNRLQNYIRKHTKKPVVLYISDDNYSFHSVSKTPISLLLRCWLRMHEKKLIQNASKIMVISQKQKEEYDRLFHANCTILTKGIDFSDVPYAPKPVGSPIRMVYTGKLIIGRWKSLAKIAEVLGKINRHSEKIVLDIYTTDTLTKKQQKQLNRNGCMVRGAINFEQVQQVQKAADILVFVESLERKHRYAARLSFSTKITDYLQSGKCIFAVGDKDIAPIDYFSRHDSAITAVSYAEIERKLLLLVEDTAQIAAYGQKAYDCGRKHHNKEQMKSLLSATIARAAESFVV